MMSNEDCIYGVPSEEVKTDLSFQHLKKKKKYYLKILFYLPEQKKAIT